MESATELPITTEFYVNALVETKMDEIKRLLDSIQSLHGPSAILKCPFIPKSQFFWVNPRTIFTYVSDISRPLDRDRS